jgi:hypothetical protein
MAEALRFEKADELGNPIKCLKTPNPTTARPPRGRCQAKKPRIDTSHTTVDVPEDVLVVSSGDDDPNYEGTMEYTSAEESELSTDPDWPGEYDTIEMMLCPSNVEVIFFIFILSHNRQTNILLDR